MWIIFNFNVFFAFCLSVIVLPVYAGDDVILNFSGTIRNKACEINPNSITKTVNLGDVGGSVFKNIGDLSPPKELEIEISCASYSPQKATVKFEGLSDEQDPSLLALDNSVDSAKGVAIQISDKDGTKIDLGNNSKSINIIDGSNILHFIARYQAVESGNNVTVGSANATANFTINYQ